MKLRTLNSNLAKALLLTACSCALTSTGALSQDYKPGDPINFGSAHKPMFGDTAAPRGGPSFVPVQPQAAPTADTVSAGQGVPSNFLNSRSIPWKPGDPVTFGSAHRPYAPEDPPSPGTSPATTYGTGTVAAPAAPMPVVPAPVAAPTADGDLREAPTASTAPATHHARRPAPVAQSAPPTAVNQGGTPNDPGKARSSSSSSASSGNIFSRAFHWLFGGNK